MLLSASVKAIYEQEMRHLDALQTGSPICKPTLSSQMAAFSHPQYRYTFAEIELHTRGLQSALPRFPLEGSQVPVHLPSSVIEPLQGWLSISESRTLWIYGRSNILTPSDLSLISGYVISVAQSIKIPFIAHRCLLEDTAVDSLIRMTYSLILRPVWLLPERFSTNADLGSGRSAALDGSSKTLQSALIFTGRPSR